MTGRPTSVTAAITSATPDGTGSTTIATARTPSATGRRTATGTTTNGPGGTPSATTIRCVMTNSTRTCVAATGNAPTRIADGNHSPMNAAAIGSRTHTTVAWKPTR